MNGSTGTRGWWSAMTGVQLPMAQVLVAVTLAAIFLAAPPLAAESLGSIHIISGPNTVRISGSTVTVTWVTDKAKPGLVKWGKKKGEYHHQVKEADSSLNHSVTITGLSQNTTYHFRVVTGTAKSADGKFTTANFSDGPFTFADMGDNRGTNHDTDMVSVTPSFQNILNTAVAKKPAFTVHVGDIFHGPGDESQMEKMYGVFKAAIQPLINASSFTQYPFTVSPGNHEMSPCHPPCTSSFDPYAYFNQQMPNQPQNGPPGYLGTCFSFDYGNTHVASMDTCRYNGQATTYDFDFFHLSDAELDWLDQDLAAAQANHVRHIFVFGHAQAFSPDGVDWTTQSSGTQADLYAFNEMVLVGASGTILTSQDGSTWTPVTSGTSATLRGIASNLPTIMVTVGDNGTVLTSANSGTTWTAATSGTTQQLNGIVFAGSLFVAVGNAGTIVTSAGGTAWTAQNSGTTQNLYAVAHDAEGSQDFFVAVGASGTVLTSSDGSTWTARTSGTSRDLHGVDSGYINGLPMLGAVGAAGTVVTSPDGVAWTPQSSGITANLNAVVNVFQFTAAGDGGTVVTSNDGVHWTQQTSNATANLLGIAHLHADDLTVSGYFGMGTGGALIQSVEWLGDSSIADYQSQRDRFWQILSSHGVDAYLCGHVHESNDSFSSDGVVQWLCGNSGSTGIGNGRWTLWSIDGDTATADLLDESGNVTHTRVIQSSQP